MSYGLWVMGYELLHSGMSTKTADVKYHLTRRGWLRYFVSLPDIPSNKVGNSSAGGGDEF